MDFSAISTIALFFMLGGAAGVIPGFILGIMLQAPRGSRRR